MPSSTTRRSFLASTVVGVGLANFVHSQRKKSEFPITGTDSPLTVPLDDLFKNYLIQHKLPGLTVALTRQGKLVYSRGLGYADVPARKAMQPNSIVRLASVSKVLTAVAILRLIEATKLTFDTEVYDLLRLRPFLPEQAKLDPRWKKVTIRQCLQHTTGMDRDISGDPIEMTYEIARAMGTEPPPSVPQLLRFSLGRPLDHDPGTAYAYGNIGYLMLGRVIAAITKTNYYDAVRGLVLKPLGMASTLQARSIPNKRPDREVSYYDTNGNTGTGLVPPVLGKQVPTPDGGSNLENFEGFGGWASTAQDMVRLASAFDDPSKCQLLKEETISAMWARPDGAPGRTANGRPKSVYYGCGWNVRPIDEGNRVNAWHFGILSGVSTLLVRRNDGFTWALLFNGDYLQDGKTEAAWDIAEAIHPVVDGITKWPTDDLFEKDK